MTKNQFKEPLIFQIVLNMIIIDVIFDGDYFNFTRIIQALAKQCPEFEVKEAVKAFKKLKCFSELVDELALSGINDYMYTAPSGLGYKYTWLHKRFFSDMLDYLSPGYTRMLYD